MSEARPEFYKELRIREKEIIEELEMIRGLLATEDDRTIKDITSTPPGKAADVKDFGQKLSKQVFLDEKPTKHVEDLDGEQWQDIEGYPTFFVSNMGRVKRIRFKTTRGRWINESLVSQCGNIPETGITDENGKRTKRYVRILVAKAFIPNPDNRKYVINIDGDLKNNKADNLIWLVPKKYEPVKPNPVKDSKPEQQTEREPEQEAEHTEKSETPSNNELHEPPLEEKEQPTAQPVIQPAVREKDSNFDIEEHGEPDGPKKELWKPKPMRKAKDMGQRSPEEARRALIMNGQKCIRFDLNGKYTEIWVDPDDDPDEVKRRYIERHSKDTDENQARSQRAKESADKAREVEAAKDLF